MEKTYAQKVTELTARITLLTTLRDAGMHCQSALDDAYTDRDRLTKRNVSLVKVKRKQEHAHQPNQHKRPSVQ